MTLSAAFTINSVANPAEHTCAYSSTVTLAIASLAYNTISWSIVGSSKSGESTPTITLGGTPNGSTATFSMPASPGDDLGRSFRVKCRVTDALGNESVQYGIVGAVNGNGLLPVTVGEEGGERNATHGWTEVFNAGIATAGGGGSGSTDTVKSAVRLATAAALPAHNFAANVMTATSNGALTVDSTAVVAGDRVLVKNEAESHLQHGIYTVTQAGSGGTPWILTRATDWDASDEFETGSSVQVLAGNQARSVWSLATVAPITLNTTALKFIPVSGVEAIDPRWFGTFLPDDATDISAAFQAAISAGVAAKVPVRLPPGNYYRDMVSGGTLLINGDLEVYGAGRTLTRVRCGPDTNSARSGGTNGIEKSFTAHVTIRAMTWRGPAETDSGDFGTKPTNGIVAVGTVGTPGSLTLRDIKTERFSHPVRCTAQPCTLYDCHIEAQRAGILVTDGCRLTLSGVDMDTNWSYATDPGDTTTHCIYANNGAHQSLSRVRFLHADSFCWHTYGGVGGVAEYCRATDCDFQSATGGLMITNTTCLTEVTLCRFTGVSGSRSVQLAGSSRSQFTNCSFFGSPAQHVTTDASVGQTHTTQFTDCFFGGTPGSSIYSNLNGGAVGKAKFKRCTFKSDRAPVASDLLCTIAGGLIELDDCVMESQVQNTMSGSPTLTFTEVGGTGDTIGRSAGSWITDGFYAGHFINVSGTVSNNFTSGDVASGTSSTLTMGTQDLANETDATVTVTTTIIPCIKMNAGELRIKGRTRFTNGKANINLNPTIGAVTADLDTLVFEASDSGGNLVNLQKGANTLTIRQREGRYATLWSGNISGSGTLVGDMQFAKGRGADIASASTIVVGLGWDSYRVTGTTDVATIETSPAALLPAVTGTIYIIAVSGFALLTSGNIVPRGNSKRQIAANEIVALTYDPTAAKWIEVGGEVLPSSGTAPTEVEGAGAGTGASTTVTGGATAFKVALTTGTGAAAGLLSTLTLSRNLANAFATISPANANAEALGARAVATGGSPTTVAVSTQGTPADATLYEWIVTVAG
jgi:hypothetical protein